METCPEPRHKTVRFPQNIESVRCIGRIRAAAAYYYQQSESVPVHFLDKGNPRGTMQSRTFLLYLPFRHAATKSWQLRALLFHNRRLWVANRNNWLLKGNDTSSSRYLTRKCSSQQWKCDSLGQRNSHDHEKVPTFSSQIDSYGDGFCFDRCEKIGDS